MSNAATIATPTDAIAQAKADLDAARLLKKNATTAEEVKQADQLVIEALKAYRKIAPRQAPKRPDPAVTPEVVHIQAREAREEERQPTLGDVLEPEMQRLLANQTLRAAALREFERWEMWLREAHAQITMQPVAAQALVSEVITALAIKARDLKDAPIKEPKSRKGAK